MSGMATCAWLFTSPGAHLAGALGPLVDGTSDYRALLREVDDVGGDFGWGPVSPLLLTGEGAGDRPDFMKGEFTFYRLRDDAEDLVARGEQTWANVCRTESGLAPAPGPTEVLNARTLFGADLTRALRQAPA